jgi:hypothetical protein
MVGPLRSLCRAAVTLGCSPALQARVVQPWPARAPAPLRPYRRPRACPRAACATSAHGWRCWAPTRPRTSSTCCAGTTQSMRMTCPLRTRAVCGCWASSAGRGRCEPGRGWADAACLGRCRVYGAAAGRARAVARRFFALGVDWPAIVLSMCDAALGSSCWAPRVVAGLVICTEREQGSALSSETTP